MFVATADPATPPPFVRVGVFENRPIVFTDAGKGQAGIAIDVLEAIANRQGWRLRYMRGTWAEQLENLTRGDIDLLVGIAYSDKRAQQFNFSRENLIGNWGVLYQRPELAIHSPLDLKGRRVAVMKGSIHTQALDALLKSFNVDYQPVFTGSYEEVLAAVHQGQADAGAVNRIFGIMRASHYTLSQTGVVFNPIYIHYAASKTSPPAILSVIDRELAALKKDRQSVYYASLERWLESHERVPSHWLQWGGVVALVLALLAVSIGWRMRHQIRRKTRELSEKSMALQVESDKREHAQQRLNELAYFDPLTGLPNRTAFTEHFDAARHDADRYQNTIALLLLDIDRFKNINDSLGHAVGDQLIQAAARRLQSCLRGGDTIYRFGGDEFVITVGHVADASEVDRVARRLLASLTGPIELAHLTVYATASIGIALYPSHATSLENLLRNADAAMYAAKERGRNQSQLYDPSFTQRAVERLTTETRLRSALAQGELVLYYQPIIDLLGDNVVGVEALLRWCDPERGTLLPKSFVPSAEESGMIVPIGKWVLAQACRDVRHFEDMGLGALRLSVNVSSRQFEHHELLAAVRDALRESGLPPERLELEITEGVFLVLSPDVRATLASLTALGVRFAIDDFGTGYSSLGFLKHLPFDDLKIDRSFVAGIPRDTDDAQIATTIINMARDLGMNVVAEGVETREQCQFLRARGCPHGQGHYFSPALPAFALAQWLRERSQRPAIGAARGQ